MKLKIIYHNGEVSEFDLSREQESLGITAIGCVFKLMCGTKMIVHPSSVRSMRIYQEEANG